VLPALCDVMHRRAELATFKRAVANEPLATCALQAGTMMVARGSHGQIALSARKSRHFRVIKALSCHQGTLIELFKPAIRVGSCTNCADSQITRANTDQETKFRYNRSAVSPNDLIKKRN
jgi:hypothetical protein